MPLLRSLEDNYDKILEYQTECCWAGKKSE